MNRRQKIIVSVVGIFIILLALVGITYGYFLTRIQGNTNTTSITVTTADLKLVYGDGNGNVSPSGVISPDNENFIKFSNNTNTKTFTVTNDGNATVENYVVVVEDISVTYASNATLEDGTSVTLGQPTTFNRPEDFVYVLTCKSYTGYGTDSQTETGTCNEVANETILPMEDSILVTNTIDEDVTHAYELKIKYLNPDIDQSKDMNKTFSLKVNIEDIRNFNPYKDGTLANAIFTNNKIKKNNNTPVFDGVATEEEGMYPAEDDYGISWYFRGAQQNNYVNFAGFTWRIVRINGDGSIRLILDGSFTQLCLEYNTDGTICTKTVGESTAFNSTKDDNAYVGYMYGLTGVTSDNVCVITTDGVKSIDINITDETSCTGEWMSGYDATHMNLNDSTAKDNIDIFFETYIENETTGKKYGEYLSDTLFCGDKTIAKSKIGIDNSTIGYGNNITYYAAVERLYYSASDKSIMFASPTLKCAEGEDNTYSRYTVNSETTTKGIKTNGNLTHPIALITADELLMAGAWGGEGTHENTSYYLYDAYENNTSDSWWWTMTPFDSKPTRATMFCDSARADTLSFVTVHHPSFDYRPVINLRADLLVDSGNGTSGSGAYTVKLPS